MLMLILLEYCLLCILQGYSILQLGFVGKAVTTFRSFRSVQDLPLTLSTLQPAACTLLSMPDTCILMSTKWFVPSVYFS